MTPEGYRFYGEKPTGSKEESCAFAMERKLNLFGHICMMRGKKLIAGSNSHILGGRLVCRTSKDNEQ